MKKQLLLILAFFVLQPFLKAQTMNLSTFSCANSFTASLSGSVTTANSYTWSTVPASNISYMGGIYATFLPTVSTLYTVICQPYNGTTPLTPITGTIQYNGAPNLSVNGFSNFASYTICSGTQLTLTAQGANTYTWTGNVQSSSLTVGPVGNTIYNVSGSMGSCVSTMDVAVYVTPNSPTISFGNSPTTVCNGVANLIASGASSYVWSNGPTTAANPVTTLGCYTVTGSNSCGSSTAAICVTGSATTPTLSLSGLSNALCVNSPVTLTASGAPNLTIAGYPNNSYLSVASATIVFTPTIAASMCFTVTGNNGGCQSSMILCGAAPNNTAISVSGSTVYCSNATTIGTLSASGAVSYTWSNGSTGPLLTFTPTASTCYTVIGTNACGNTVMASRCITILQTPTLSISGNPSICAGTSNIFTATGATTYTWLSGNYSYLGSGSSLALSPTVGCFFVNVNTNGCGATSNTICTSTVPTPTIVIAATSSVVCAGSSLTLTASGANTYTWSNLTTGSAIVIAPNTTACYTVMGSNANGCVQSAVRCIIVTPVPGTGAQTYSTVCAGSSLVLAAAGGNTYSWSTGANTPTVSVSPSVNTCYTVTGTNVNGCSSQTIRCVNVLPLLTLSINGTDSVCLGTSAFFTATGGVTYNWSSGPMSNTITLIPSASTLISVSSTGANGCVATTSKFLTVKTNCSDVWPGDANSDGVVTSSDVLEIGAAFNNTGAARTLGGNSWTSKYANNWTGTVSTGKNKVHADCNGDGTINANDTLAIYNNLTLTHAFRPGSPAVDPELQLTSENNVAYIGIWNKIDILLGNNTQPNFNITGLSFDLRYDFSLISGGNIYLDYNPSSPINSGNQSLRFRKADISNGTIYAANIKTDKVDVSTSGKIASLYFQVDPLSGEGDTIAIALNNAKTMNSALVLGDLQGGIIKLPVSRSVGLKEQSKTPAFSVFPNPAQYTIRINGNGKSFKIMDLSGRVVIAGSLNKTTDVAVSALASGVYFVEVQNETGTTLKKLIITE